MWIFLNDAFLSIIDPKAAYTGGKGPVSNKLLVRARIKGDIERAFPEANVTETPNRDYRFRAMIDRREVADTMAARVMAMDYGNFKGSVAEKARHDAYTGVWRVMHREQERRAGRPGKRGQQGFWDDEPEYGRINRRY